LNSLKNDYPSEKFKYHQGLYSIMEKLLSRIAGDIVLSDNPGAAMKKWREIFRISQAELAKTLNITPSTLSDYESGRRKSPGVHVIKRFVEALLEIDKKRGGKISQKLLENTKESVFYVKEFAKPLSLEEFINRIEGRVIANQEKISGKHILGYTIIDSMKAILEIPLDEMIKIYGTTPERALIFTGVSTGRSPMIAIRVTKLKPHAVVFHNLEKVDRLAIKIAEVEGIPLVLTYLPVEEIKRRLEDY